MLTTFRHVSGEQLKDEKKSAHKICLLRRIIIAIYFELIKDRHTRRQWVPFLALSVMANMLPIANLDGASARFLQPVEKAFFWSAHLPVHEDKQLVSRCLSGSEADWNVLHQRIYSHVYFITHWKKWHFTHEEAEELMQDVFMGMVTALKAFNFDCSLETYASHIARRRCITELRKKTAAKRDNQQEAISIQAVDEDKRPLINLEDKRPSLEERLITAETGAHLQAMLNSLGERCREIIRLKYYDNRSYDEIVVILQAPLGTVASRLKRCLLELRRLIEKSGGDLL